ncbi:hypothetical protein ABT174_27525 [Streptomyces sparsogenes]|uniref:hypothetical protein n=1 Tax=Streptomyces sparsogenes TaxID=67365 RepID=UPI0033264674
MAGIRSGRAPTCGTLRVAGVDGPQYTPARSVTAGGDHAKRRAGRQRAAGIRAQKTPGRSVDDAEPDKVQASVLYLDRDTHRPQAGDEIDLGGPGLAKAEVSPHLPAENSPRARPPPGSS